MRETLSRVFRGETKIDFIGRRNLWFMLSALVLAICLASLFIRQLNFGIEFEGGLQIKVPIGSDSELADANDLDVIAEVRDSVESAGVEDAQIQVEGEGSERSILVQTEQTGEAAKRGQEAVEDLAASPATDIQEIGPRWGQEITEKAVRALLIFLVVIFIYISIRFEWKMGLAGIIALLHDLLITAGVYSLVGFEVTPSTVVAILTILGYSLYDTVVVFDKVEEDTSLYAAAGKMTYQDAANMALNEVFMRSLNTSLATLLPVAALLFVGVGLLGADTLQDLALALFVGLVVGAYSSIFVATPVLSMLKEREPRYRSVRERVLKEVRRTEKLAAVTPSEVTEAPAPAAPKPSAPPTRPARAKAGTKKARRRRRR
jgi:preprotein translocase subunit SecF